VGPKLKTAGLTGGTAVITPVPRDDVLKYRVTVYIQEIINKFWEESSFKS
jgi:hypothetical protein